MNALRRGAIVNAGQIDEAVKSCNEPSARFAAIIGAVTIRFDEKARAVVPLDQLRDQPTHYIPAQIVRHIAEADRAFGRHSRMAEWRDPMCSRLAPSLCHQ